jgi:hypothetical protein
VSPEHERVGVALARGWASLTSEDLDAIARVVHAADGGRRPA